MEMVLGDCLGIVQIADTFNLPDPAGQITGLDAAFGVQGIQVQSPRLFIIIVDGLANFGGELRLLEIKI